APGHRDLQLVREPLVEEQGDAGEQDPRHIGVVEQDVEDEAHRLSLILPEPAVAPVIIASGRRAAAPVLSCALSGGSMAEAAIDPGKSRAHELVRGLGLLDATTLIMGSVIGSGIFFAPSIMAGYLQSPGLLLGLWVLGGFLTLAGALSYAEMAAAMPK